MCLFALLTMDYRLSYFVPNIDNSSFISSTFTVLSYIVWPRARQARRATFRGIT